MEASPKNGSHRMLSMQPDALLCALSARGNEDAFGILHARYRQQVFAFVYHLLGRPGCVDDAEDLTQEIMQKAYANLNTRRNGGSFKAWLFRIARNHTFDHIRASRPDALSLDDAGEAFEPSNVVSLHGQVEWREQVTWLVGAMGALPERQRQALVMRELGGQSVDEIADVLGTTPESAKQLIKRGRASVTEAAQSSGYRSKRLGRELAAAAPITAIAWLGAGKASAATGAAATAGAVGATGGVAASASGAGIAVVSGKVAATVFALVAIGTGSVVVGEQAVSGSHQSSNAAMSDRQNVPAVPAQSLAVGTNAAERAAANKRRSNEKRARAAAKRAKARAKGNAKRAAAKANANRGRSSGRSNKGRNSSRSSAGSTNSKAGGGKGTQTTAPSTGSANRPAGPPSAAGGSAKGNGGSVPAAGGGKPTD